jgi:diketogulonate reductase-like aldo/keto reductase
MQYRRLGRSGLKLSALSYGSWVTFGTALNDAGVRDCLALAYERGVNFFDSAEVYLGGEAERCLDEPSRHWLGPGIHSVFPARSFMGPGTITIPPGPPGQPSKG